MTRRIVYLTWGETPRAYGLYRSQVAETLRDLAEHLPNDALTLIAGVPILHSGLAREKWRYGREISNLRCIMGPVGFERARIPVPQNFVFPTRRSFNMIFTGASFSLLPKLKRLMPDVVHCRSMLAGWIAQSLRLRHGLDYRILYDARSLWPEMQYRLRPDEADLAAFKEREAQLAAAADAVVSVNQPMAEHYAAMGARHSWVNYLAADIHETATAPPPEPVKLFYAGALHEGGMQDPRLLLRLFAHINALRTGTQLTIVTTSPHGPLQQMAQQILPPDMAARISFTSARSPAEVAQIASRHHLACNAYKAPTTENDRLLCATGFSTKSAEYLAAGLPILVSAYPRAIGHLVTTQKTGAVFDESQPDFALTRAELNRLLHPDLRETCRAVARAYFDRKAVSQRYSEFYDRLCTPEIGARR